jgi:hypothetical protein
MDWMQLQGGNMAARLSPVVCNSLGQMGSSGEKKLHFEVSWILTIFTHVLFPLFWLNFALGNMVEGFTQNINVTSP